MLFREIEGKEIIDSHGERIGFVQDLVFTNSGKVTHIIAMPKGIIHKVKRGQLNIQFEDIQAIEDVIMLNRSEDQLLGAQSTPEPVPRLKLTEAEAKPARVLLKKKSK